MTADQALAEIAMMAGLETGLSDSYAAWHAAISSELSALRKVLIESPIPEHPCIELTPEVREAIEVAIVACSCASKPESPIEHFDKAAEVLRGMLK